MFADYRNPPHPLIQSHYIMLCTNVDIYYAMNYILSAFCNGFDQVAVVTLLKQLSVSSAAHGRFVGIIKAIWDELFHHINLKNDVLYYANRKVAIVQVIHCKHWQYTILRWIH